MLRYVATCWGLLAQILKRLIFHATFVDVAWCCSRLTRFVQQCCVKAYSLVRFSTRNMTQHIATGWPNACNMLRPTILRSFGRSLQLLSQQCWDMLGWDVAIVWPGLNDHQGNIYCPSRNNFVPYLALWLLYCFWSFVILCSPISE